jgi:tetratricopeptide (TPR) repeat protein
MDLNEQIARTLKLLNKASMAAVSMGQYEKAIDLLEQEMKLELDLGLSLQAAESRMNLANVFLIMGDSERAKANAAAALDVFAANRQGHHACNAVFVLGEIQLQEGACENALLAYRDCLRMGLDGKDESACHMKIALASLRMDDAAGFLEHIQRAIHGFERIPFPPGLRACLMERARFYEGTGKTHLARMDMARHDALYRDS